MYGTGGDFNNGSKGGAPCGKGGFKGGFKGKDSFGKDGGNLYSGVAGFGKGGRGGFEDEDRSRDWYCPNCSERNFMKRKACFKCGTERPKDADLRIAPPRPQAPQSGTTLNGMVKSYNRKGFGFLMCLGSEYSQDIYYTRENLSPHLQTRDIPGQHVTFEIHRFGDGKLTAVNIRPQGESKEEAFRPRTNDQRGGSGGSRNTQGDEDRTRDWDCKDCGERNFMKRMSCHKCGAARPLGFSEGGGRDRSRSPGAERPKRGLSPHAGSRAYAEALKKKLAARGGGGSKRSKSSDSSDASSKSSESRRKRKKDKKKKKKKRKRSSSSSASSSKKRSKKKSRSSSSGSSGCEMEAPSSTAAVPTSSGSNPEVDKMKAEALEELLKLKKIESKETRMSEWRALLRKWHPDKNPDRTEVATAVFQFLQKGKAILDN